MTYSQLSRAGRGALRRYLPGVVLCGGVSGLAVLLEQAETAIFGRAWLGTLVLAILAGTAVRSLWTPPVGFEDGISLCAKTLLEVAVVMLGASVSTAALMAVGPALLAGVVAVVIVAIASSFAIGRLLGLSPQLAILVACGNSICGNSAIAAVAPIIRANEEDVAASMAFTAVLGVGVVLALPMLSTALHLSNLEAGALAGLTVYAVPQVIAATAPFGATAVQMGTLIKVVRVLMLGPVCLALSLVGRSAAGARACGRAKLPSNQIIPWFVLGFLGLMVLRSAGLLSLTFATAIAQGANVLALAAMAALGLSVDLRSITQAGGRVTLVVVLSLAALGAISLTLIYLWSVEI